MRALPALLLLAALPASAADVGGWTSFRCPTTGRLVALGSSPYEVIAKCRVPEERLAHVETRTRRVQVSETEWRELERTRPPSTPATPDANVLPGSVIARRVLPPEPESRRPERRDGTRTTRVGVASEVTYGVEETVVVHVERWTYDFGRNRFLRKLVFENGALVSIADGDKGALPPERRR